MKDFLSENWISVLFWTVVVVVGGYFFGSDPEFWEGLFQGER